MILFLIFKQNNLKLVVYLGHRKEIYTGTIA